MEAKRRAAAFAALALASLAALALPAPSSSASATTSPVPASAPLRVDDGVTVDQGGHRVDGPVGADDHGADTEYALTGTAWPAGELTYGFVNHTGDLSVAAQEAAVARAFATWASVTSLTFRKVTDCGLVFDAPGCTSPDIRISFVTGRHSGAAYDPAFTGPGGTAAHAFYPPPNGASAAGDLHIDDAERWTTNGNGVDLESIVLHELGHALGLDHASLLQCPPLPSASRPIMCATVIGVDRTLAADDINGIRRLYGMPAVRCGGRAVTVDLAKGERPTNGPDVILGTPGDDVIAALGGADIVCGGGGDDRIDLGPGNDRGIGGPGNDVILGRAGNDRLEGGAGADRLVGGVGRDRLFGARGPDVLDGGAGADDLAAGPQVDRCHGRGGRDAQSGCERTSSVERRLRR